MADIKHRIHFDSTPQKVFEAITTQKGLECWWTSDVQVDSETKNYVFGFHGHSILFRMSVEKEILNEYVEWQCHGELEEWTDTRLIFRISEREDGKVQLDFTHADWKSSEGSFPHCNTDWGHLMYYLKDYVEGRNDTAFMG